MPRRLPAPLVLAVLLSLAACGRGNAPPALAGTVEVNEASLAPSVPARVVRLAADEGQAVRAGDTVAVLTQATLPATRAEQEARLAAARATLAELEHGTRAQDLRAAEAELAGAEAEATRAVAERDRMRRLGELKVVSRQQVEDADAAAELATSRRDAAAERLAALREGPRRERVEQARAEVARARAALAGVEATATDLVLVAPFDGRVLVRHAEPGELLQPGAPVLTVGEAARPWVSVYVPAHLAARLAPGDSATVALAGVPDRRYAGRVLSVASRAEFTPRVALTDEERADLMFRVRVAVADTTGVVKAGLPATVAFAVAAQ